MTDVQISWEIDVSPGRKTYFIEMLRKLSENIDPGDSPIKIRIVADDIFVTEIQAMTGKVYQYGPHATTNVNFPIVEGNTFSSVILLRQEFFTPADNGPLEQTSALIGALYQCQIYDQTWRRRGYLQQHSADLYFNDRFAMCQQMHDAYAVSRLKNILLGRLFDIHMNNDSGQIIPYFIQYGQPLATFLDQAPDQLRACDILQVEPLWRKDALLRAAYRFAFEPLARHAGFLAPIPDDYPLRRTDNEPETSAFYREVIAPYWATIKNALESSFDSQFSKTEESLHTMSETMDSCLDKLLEISITQG